MSLNLKQLIEQWLNYDSNISKINKVLKEQKLQKEKLESTILSIIENNNLQNSKLTIKNLNITYKLSESQPPLTLKLLKEVLEEAIPNKNIIENIIDIIALKRENNKKTVKHLKKSYKLEIIIL